MLHLTNKHSPLAFNETWNTITIELVKQKCQQVDLNTAPGIDKIPPHFYRHASNKLIAYIHYLFILSCHYGKIPSE